MRQIEVELESLKEGWKDGLRSLIYSQDASSE